MIVAEIIPITSSMLAESLSYFSASQITPGTVVTIPLRKKEIKGIVISTSTVKNIKQSLRNQNFKIRNITKIHNETIFSPAYLTTINQLKNYYVLPAGKLIDITYPKHITKNFDEFSYSTIGLPQSKNKKYSKILLQKIYPERIEFYKDLISKKNKRDESIQIICPTVLDVDKIYKSLKPFFEGKIYSLSGKTSKKKLTKVINKIKIEESIVISTTNFIDLAIKNKSTIILERDSSSYYYRAVAPYIDFRILIEQYAKNSNTELIISDNILRPFRFTETNTQEVDMNIFSSEKISLISSIDKAESKQTDSERIKSISLKKEFSPFSNKILKQIKKSIENKEKIFFYTQRKGLAPSITCRNCGNLAQNIATKVPYSLYVKKNKNTEEEYYYVNKISGEVLPAFDTCQFCGSWKLQTLGVGTETIKKELEKIFPDIKNQTHVIDSTHTTNQTELKKVVESFNSDNLEANILIGTQKAIPHINNIDTSYIISIDGIFYQSSYTNEDRALTLIKQIYDKSDNTFIQTRSTNKAKEIKANLKKNTKKEENDILQIKFSKRLESVLNKIKFSPEVQKHMSSKYTESLKIWNTIRTGNYKKYIEESNKKAINNKTILKINHICRRNDYLSLINIYKERFVNYNHIVKHKAHPRKDLVILTTTLFLDENTWDLQFQDPSLYQKLPFGERNIDIEVNPDVF